jgi:hypothetical protein
MKMTGKHVSLILLILFVLLSVRASAIDATYQERISIPVTVSVMGIKREKLTDQTVIKSVECQILKMDFPLELQKKNPKIAKYVLANQKELRIDIPLWLITEKSTPETEKLSALKTGVMGILKKPVTVKGVLSIYGTYGKPTFIESWKLLPKPHWNLDIYFLSIDSVGSDK